MVLQVGKSKAYIDLVGMKTDILWLMKKPFPIVMAIGTAAQLALAAAMIWYAQGGWKPAVMRDTHATAYFMAVLHEQSTPYVQNGGDTLSATERLAADQQSGSEDSLLKDNVGVVVKENPCKASGSAREELEMDNLIRRTTT
jgi:hypothetical protein